MLKHGDNVGGKKKKQQTFTDTGSGHGALLVLKAALSASQFKFNPHHKLFRSAQPLQERQELEIKERYRITSVVYIVYTCRL